MLPRPKLLPTFYHHHQHQHKHQHLGTVCLLLTLVCTFGAWTEALQSSAMTNNPQQGLVEPHSEASDNHDGRTKRSDDSSPLEAVVQSQAQELSLLKAKLQAAEAQLTSMGSTYIRWGRSDCPSNAELVYSGVAGGSKYNEAGGGANRLCLSLSPQFDQAAVFHGYHTNIHGTEWYIPGHDHTEAPCAACRVPRASSTLMVPGTRACPTGWTAQYTGHIMATHVSYTSQSEFVCVDGQPEDRPGSAAELNDGSFFMYSTASCGSLACPPYVDGKVVTCVVCSK